jgi:hypothetical protein
MTRQEIRAVGHIISNHSCYKKALGAKISLVDEEEGSSEEHERMSLPILEDVHITLPGLPDPRIPVDALLDTGCDNTIVHPKVVEQLEEEMDLDTPLKRRRVAYKSAGRQFNDPVYALAFVFPNGHVRSSRFGFIAPAAGQFDAASVCIGQDVLSQLVVTFNGLAGTVTIEDPLLS